MGQIGKELKEIYVEPLENPIPKETPDPVPQEAPAPVPEKVPETVRVRVF